MSRQLVTEVRDVLALPSFPIELQGRSTEGLLWDVGQTRLVVEALPAIRTPPRPHEVQLDGRALAAAVQQQDGQSTTIETTTIFGGYLLRHFGHFLHESLSRLWWLGRADISDPLIDALRRRLQSEGGEVVFFMPHWLDGGKDLPPYMAEVLTGLGLPFERIRILVDATPSLTRSGCTPRPGIWSSWTEAPCTCSGSAICSQGYAFE
jgi:hypothetical protein